MAEVYGVPADCVLPIRGTAHGLELVLRRLKLDGFLRIAAPTPTAELEQLARIYGLQISRAPAKGVGAIVGRAPYDVTVMAPFDVAADRPTDMPVLVVDESEIELLDTASLVPTAPVREDLVVLRSLEVVYGLAGAPCGTLIASAARVRALEEVLEPFALPTPIVRLAEAALSPSRALAVEARISGLKSERTRMHDVLKALAEVQYISCGSSEVFVLPADAARARVNLARFCAPGAWRETEEGAFAIAVGAPEANDRALAAFGVNIDSAPRRRAEVVRDTKETRIAVAVDLDADGPRKIHTGVGFFDHMLDQIAAHAGFSLTLACEGDLEIDPHHTIEDCALALGAALKQALGDRRGIGRFGFALPMDEAEAKVLIDLGGRPYAVYEGTFETSHIGEWPTEMAPHVFRSLAETLGAAIHVAVTGENDHHKTEAGFKAFGRALRQAIRVEGGDVPSTKGVL
jgi:imidazoleglycerol phosphate dehydratase HisB/histidinol-phosphate/aromatic aminotransferase/cobyric acid decarboxylase-like protein